MKHLFTFLFLITLAHPALAENWVRISDLEAGMKRGFELKASCEAGGEKCQQIDGLDFDVITVITSQVDDITKPVFEAKSNAVECETREACDLLREAADFCPTTHFSVTAKKGSDWEAYCTRLTGYEKKSVKSIGEDAAKKAAKAEAEAKLEEERAIEKKLVRMKQGSRVLAILSNRNDAKSLSANDFLAMLADQNLQAIKGLLETGALGTARDLITVYPTGQGSYFTQADKAALLADLNQFLQSEAGSP